MRSNKLAGLFAISACMFGQASSDRELARSLADQRTRGAAEEEIGARGQSMSGMLLSWARNPPHGVDKHGLYVGLSDAFGRLRTKEAIPFLVANMDLQRGLFYRTNLWMKTPDVVEEELPAVAALIQIGPDASRAMIRGFGALTPEARLGAIFVVSRVKGVPEARSFLDSVLGQANLESFWARGGIAEMDSGAAPR